MDTIRIPRTRVSETASARLAAALTTCVRDYRRAALDCPLAAAIAAQHRRRHTAGRSPRLAETIRRVALGDTLRVDPIYLQAAAACCRAGGPWNCPMRCARGPRR